MGQFNRYQQGNLIDYVAYFPFFLISDFESVADKFYDEAIHDIWGLSEIVVETTFSTIFHKLAVDRTSM